MNKISKKLFAVIGAVVIAFCLSIVAAAEDFSAIDVGSAVSDGFAGVGNDMLGMITGILPIGLGIIGAILAVTFGIKFFKKLTGRA